MTHPTTNKHETREAWLAAAVVAMTPWLKEKADLVLVPANAPISCGWGKGVRGKNPIGCCYEPGQVVDNEHARPIFIFPTIVEPVLVLATTLHEMVHAALPEKTAHKGPFKRAVRALGLEGKVTATYAEPGTPLHDDLLKLSEALGPYPHSAMVLRSGPKTKGKGWPRYKSINEEKYKVLVSPKMLEEHGPPTDPWGDLMIANDVEPEGEED